MGKTRKLKKNLRFWPPKYYRGLTLKQKILRKKEIESRKKYNWTDSRAYRKFKTNTLGKTKKSSYTKKWNKLIPEAKSLEERSKVTGVPLKYIKECYNRGMAAYKTGHRPFATQQQWGYARVSSLLCFGKTAKTTDADIVRRAKAESASAKKWFDKVEKYNTCNLDH